MLTPRARTPVEALCKRSFGMDCRIKSGNDEREERKKKDSEAKRRQTQGSSAVPYGHGRASKA
jgi:hypothetical protein